MKYEFVVFELIGGDIERLEAILADMPLWGKPAPLVSSHGDTQA